MRRPYGVGIIGAGGIVDAHLAALRGLRPRAIPVALAEIDPNRLRQVGRRHFLPHVATDYRWLLQRSDVDVVCILTPPASHAGLAEEALSAGKTVVCEKPLATNLAQLDRLAELDRAYPGRLSTVYQRRYFPEMLELVAQVRGGRLGRLVGGHFCRYSGENARRGAPAGAGGVRRAAAPSWRSSSTSST